MNTDALIPLLRVVVALLPRSCALWLGSHVGILLYVLDRRRRRAAQANLLHTLAVGRPHRAVSRLARQSFVHQGMRFVELLRLEKYTRRHSLRYVHLRGKSHAADALTRNGGVLYLTSQLGNPELTGTVLRAMGYPCVEVVSPVMRRRFSKVMSPGRMRKRVMVVDNEGTKARIVARLKDGERVCIAIDPNGQACRGCVDFFGRRTSASLLPAELAIKTGAAVVPTFLLLDDYNHYILLFEKPLRLIASGSRDGDVVSSTRSFYKVIEKTVRKHPAQWPWARSTWRPPESQHVRKPFFGVRRVLVKMPNWLGDAVMSLPAIEYLRRLFPDAYLAALVKEGVADIARDSRTLDCVISYNHGTGLPAIWKKMKTIRRIRRGFFDLAVLLTNSFESALWMYRAGIPLRIGYRGEGRSFLLSHAIRKKQHTVHQIQEYLDLCRALGKADESAVPRVHVSSRDAEWAEDFLGSLGFSSQDLLVGFCPGAAYGSAKRWLSGRFIELAKRIQDQFPAKFIIFGGKGDLEPCFTISDGINSDAVNLCGKTTLTQLAALLRRCALVVANDSGSLHLAAAIGTPVIGIFGPTDPQRNAPPENCTVIKKNIECSPCYKRECPADLRCMTSISVEEVYQEAAAALSRDKAKPAGKKRVKRKA